MICSAVVFKASSGAGSEEKRRRETKEMSGHGPASLYCLPAMQGIVSVKNIYQPSLAVNDITVLLFD